jgi:hypothetical protein
MESLATVFAHGRGMFDCMHTSASNGLCIALGKTNGPGGSPQLSLHAFDDGARTRESYHTSCKLTSVDTILTPRNILRTH